MKKLFAPNGVSSAGSPKLVRSYYGKNSNRDKGL